MNDIVKRLRGARGGWWGDAYDAANEIERLRLELKAAQAGIGALQGTVERLRDEVERLKLAALQRLRDEVEQRKGRTPVG